MFGKKPVIFKLKKVLIKISKKDKNIKENPEIRNEFRFSLLGFKILILFIIFPL